ncbi:MAG TPA: ATP-dependent metallopeptidase FtsH/Yme1/Tma family protein, partial [bacterium]|nr:ATP-dependent metallopeptidase FtsH/Yme1/Tma family protein [bacterium]
MEKYVRHLVVWALTLAIVLYFVLPLFLRPNPAVELAYSEFLAKTQTGEVTQVTINDKTVTGRLKDGRDFRSYVPANDSSYIALLQAKGVNITVQPSSQSSLWSNLLTTMLPFLVLIGLWMLMLRQAQSSGPGQALSFGKSRARLHTETKISTTFRDVAGVDEAKEELQEIIEFLRHPKKFQALGAKIPRGVLLVGPPGSGKTLLARAIAGEAGVPFFSISGSEFVEMFV